MNKFHINIKGTVKNYCLALLILSLLFSTQEVKTVTEGDVAGFTSLGVAGSGAFLGYKISKNYICNNLGNKPTAILGFLSLAATGYLRPEHYQIKNCDGRDVSPIDCWSSLLQDKHYVKASIFIFLCWFELGVIANGVKG